MGHCIPILDLEGYLLTCCKDRVDEGFYIFTACKRSLGKVMFLQVCVNPQGEGVSV